MTTSKTIVKTRIAALLVSGAVIFLGGIVKASPVQTTRCQVVALRGREPVASFASQEPLTPKRNDRSEQVAPQTGPRREDDKKPPDSTKYSYEFNQPEFYIRHILIEHDASGRGKITFERKGEDSPFDEPIELSTGALGRILGLWQALQFLDSTQSYQAAKQFPHLGTMKLRMEQEARNRTAEFNWTNNRDASALVNEYRHVADQAIFVFDIAIARENQPLNAPKLMDALEAMLNRGDLSDPSQLVPLLRDISTDEHLPLIARNHATRILKKIEK